jgi:thiamine biosynthesis lipoprotein
MKNSALIFALLLTACAQPHYATFNGFAQGTSYTIVVKDPAPGLAEKIEQTFDRIDLTFSVFNPSSLTSRINRGETEAVTPLFEECFALAKEVHAATDGYFDSTVGPLVDAWGFGPAEREEQPCVECLMEYVGMDRVRIESGRIIKNDPRVRLDFGSIAKGFTVDELAGVIEAEGASDYMVEVGGEVRARGVNAAGREWRIGIDKPASGFTRERETVVPLGGSDGRGGERGRNGGDSRRGERGRNSDGGRNGSDGRGVDGGSGGVRGLTSIATSGNYRNWFEDESGRTRVHIIDPLTGRSESGEILSASIVAESCALADGWATGVVASGTVERARRLLERAAAEAAAGRGPAIEYYVIYSEGNSTASFHSPGFPTVE